MTTEDLPALSSSQIETEVSRCFNCSCVASSPSDIAVALMALGAKVKVAGPNGSRIILVEELFASFRNTLEPGEIVTEIHVPQPPEAAKQSFLKFRIRKSVDFPIVSIASVITTKDGICKDARIALGAIAPLPVRATEAEQAIRGKKISEDTAQVAAEAAVKGAIPLRKNTYKVQIMKTLVKRALLS
jgi:xanthine dehydrogenase YagS FAD-binding subunit